MNRLEQLRAGVMRDDREFPQMSVSVDILKDLLALAAAAEKLEESLIRTGVMGKQHEHVWNSFVSALARLQGPA